MKKTGLALEKYLFKKVKSCLYFRRWLQGLFCAVPTSAIQAKLRMNLVLGYFRDIMPKALPPSRRRLREPIGFLLERNLPFDSTLAMPRVSKRFMLSLECYYSLSPRPTMIQVIGRDHAVLCEMVRRRKPPKVKFASVLEIQWS